MRLNDVAEFSKVTAGVLANYNAIATEPLLEMWFDMATDDEITIEQWRAAGKKIMRGRRFTSQPTYADFFAMICGVAPTETDCATEQVAVVMKQVRELGYYRTPVFDDPVTKRLMSGRWSWRAICSMTEDEHKWWAKEFVDAYRASERINGDEQIAIECGSRRLKLLAGGIGG